MSEKKFWNSAPNDLKPYVLSHDMWLEQMDLFMWQMGLYVDRAVSVAVSGALMGKKSKLRYFDKPFSQMEEKQESSADDFERFSAWAIAFNAGFKKEEKH